MKVRYLCPDPYFESDYLMGYAEDLPQAEDRVDMDGSDPKVPAGVYKVVGRKWYGGLVGLKECVVFLERVPVEAQP